MFFTKAGRVLAWLALVGGAIRVALAIFIATTATPENLAALSARYLGSTTGEAIDQGLTVVVFGIGLGILTEISRAVNRP